MGYSTHLFARFVFFRSHRKDASFIIAWNSIAQLTIAQLRVASMSIASYASHN